jgi:hypothetical protein
LLRDDVVQVIARYDFGTVTTQGNPPRSWLKVALHRMRDQGGKNGWAEWLESALAHETQSFYLLPMLTKAEILARLPQIEALTNDDQSAGVACDALLRAGRSVDVLALLESGKRAAKQWALDRICAGDATAPAAAMVPFLSAKSQRTRMQAVQYFDRTLAAEAVPGLLALLRDPDDQIRAAASTALQRIRFAHEQESHWAHQQNGIDVRPEAALEKLLLQAKPSEPKPRRLLAIASLAALGKPEATPFLIEWCDDQDAEIASAARAATLQVHLAAKR